MRACRKINLKPGHFRQFRNPGQDMSGKNRMRGHSICCHHSSSRVQKSCTNKITSHLWPIRMYFHCEKVNMLPSGDYYFMFGRKGQMFLWTTCALFEIKDIWPREMVAVGETPMRLCLIIWSVRHSLHRQPHDEWLLLKFSLPLLAAHLDSIGVHTQETGRSWWGYHWRHGFPHSLFTAKT